jgi:hypothetical protein
MALQQAQLHEFDVPPPTKGPKYFATKILLFLQLQPFKNSAFKLTKSDLLLFSGKVMYYQKIATSYIFGRLLHKS